MSRYVWDSTEVDLDQCLLQGLAAGVFCRLWYPWLHRTALSSSLFSRLRPERLVGGAAESDHSTRVVAVKTIADQIPFLAFVAAQASTTALYDGALGEAESLEAARKIATAPSTLSQLSRKEQDYVHNSITAASIDIQTRASPGWILQPLLSALNFRFVPVPFQGLVSLWQSALMSAIPVIFNKEKLLVISSALDALDMHALEQGDDEQGDDEFGFPGEEPVDDNDI